MKLEIKFVGVHANALLIERVQELFDERLEERVTDIEHAELKIGESMRCIENELVEGKARIRLRDGRVLDVHTESNRLKHLIDATLHRLNKLIEGDATEIPARVRVGDPHLSSSDIVANA